MPTAHLVAALSVGATANVGVPRLWFWVAFAIVSGARLLLFGHFLLLARRNLWSGLRLITSQLYQTTDERERAAIHESVAKETNEFVDGCLLAGTLALAAWTALFAVANQAPARELSSTSRSLLLVGAIVLVGTPILFRAPDCYTTYLGRRSGQMIGLTAVGLAFASLADDLLRGDPRIVAVLVGVVVLVARDLTETVQSIIAQRKYVGPALIP